MTKKDLVDRIASETGLKKVEVEKVLTSFQGAVVDTLKVDDSIALLGFGTFSVSNRSSRQSINPATKEMMTVPACKVGKFKFSKNVNSQLL